MTVILPYDSLTCFSKIWDAQTGECLHTLTHEHVVRAVAFPLQFTPQCVATGGAEKKLRIFDLTRSSTSSPASANGSLSTTNVEPPAEGYELGPGMHAATIKAVVWMVDYNILTTATEDKTIRWWDLRTRRPVSTFVADQGISSCELNTLQSVTTGDPGILSVAAGKTCYFFDGGRPGEMMKKVSFDHEVASVAVNCESRRFVTGGRNDTWVRVWDLDIEKELGECRLPCSIPRASN